MHTETPHIHFRTRHDIEDRLDELLRDAVEGLSYEQSCAFRRDVRTSINAALRSHGIVTLLGDYCPTCGEGV